MSNLSDVMTLPLQIPESIPNDWIWKNLVELCNPKQWKTISSSDLTETGYRVFGANGFIGFYHEFNHEDETISVTCRGATCGTVNLIPPRTYITGNSMCLDNLTKEVSKFYLFYATQFRTFSDVISGSAQPQITAEGMKKVCLPIPPLPEQKKIAAILTSVDEVIEKTQQQIDKLQDLKKATMNELLTKGIGHTEFKDSPVGRIPKSWRQSFLSQLTTKITDGSHYSPPTVRSKFPIATVENMTETQIDIGRCRTISKEEFIKLSANSCRPQIGDVLFSKDGTIGKTLVYKQFDEIVLLSSIAIIRTIESKLLPEYLEQYLSSPLFFEELEKRKSGSAIRRVVLGDLKSLAISAAPLPEQKKIADILSSMDKSIEEKKRKLEQTKNLKKALMNDLLTGKVRVAA